MTFVVQAREDSIEAQRSHIPTIHFFGFLGASKIDEENNDFEHSNIVDVHAGETDHRRWSVVESIPPCRVELSEIVCLVPR